MVRKTTFTLSLCALLAAAAQAYASADIEDCSWSDPLCLLKGDPILTPGNDSRDNLLRLLSEAKSFALPVQAIPADVSRTRDVYFAWHPEWDSASLPPAPPAQREDETFIQQMAALNIDPAQVMPADSAERLGTSDYELENRFVSNTLAAVSQFNAALLAAPSVTPQQRHDLALARLKLFYGANITAVADILNSFPADADADLFAYYLSGIAHFYGGNYPAATHDFTLLLESQQPWLSETAQYMLMRTALNKSSQNSVGQYGDFDIARINRDDAAQAQKDAQAYLQRWPAGLYADSARNMLRRINWYLQAWPQLAGLYEQAFRQAADAGELLLGNQALLNEHKIATAEIEDDMTAQASQGATPVLLAVDGQAAALFAIRDPLREDSVAALARLHRQGYRLVMLTGDNPTTAHAIAKEAGIDEVIAGVLPDGKADAIKRLQSEGHQVAMIGDGINDAPALAQADVGIAMGGGSDVAIETAAITLMRHSLNGVADALDIAKATLRNMKQNLLGAFVYNSLGIPIAAGILWPLTGTLLNPVVAGAAMALSSITVVSNANRLLRYKPKE